MLPDTHKCGDTLHPAIYPTGLWDALNTPTSLLLGKGTSLQSRIKYYLEEGLCPSITDFPTIGIPKVETKVG